VSHSAQCVTASAVSQAKPVMIAERWRGHRDQRDMRDGRIRRTVLSHVLLPHVFGAAIVGGLVNLIAGLIH